MLSVNISGAKNISLALLPAALITEIPIKLINLPKIRDISIQNQINNHLGLKIITEGNVTIYCNEGLTDYTVPKHLGNSIRSSLYYLGALISSVGKAVVPYPGGCNAQERGFDLHVGSFRFMGVNILVNREYIFAEKGNAVAKHIRLPMPSKGTTINLIYLALGLTGKTIIENASVMPEIRALVSLLHQIGYEISFDNSNIIIYGNSATSKRLVAEYSIPYDRIEAGTFAVLSLLAREEMLIVGIDRESMNDLFVFLDKIKASYVVNDNKVLIKKKQSLKPAQIYLGFPPAIDSDYGSIIAPLLCLIRGRSIIVDGHNTHRVNNVLGQLSYLKANYKQLSENVFEIYGVSDFFGNCELFGSDIRGTMGLALAAIVARGNVKVRGLNHINRAYEGFLNKISSMGFSLDID